MELKVVLCWIMLPNIIISPTLLEKHDTKGRLAMKTDVEEQFRLSAVDELLLVANSH